jgi:membrane fusion protein, multidrug efflux system
VEHIPTKTASACRGARRDGRCPAAWHVAFRTGAVLIALAADADHLVRAAPQAPAPAVTVALATLGSITPSASYVGRVQAVNTVNLIARVSGFLQQRHFKEGQRVKTGDLLFTIEQDTYQAAVDQAQANVDKAKATERNADLQLQRSQQLARTNTVPQSTVDQDLANQQSARADVEAAQAALRQAQINLGYTEIRAPIDGRIGMALITIGNFVSPTSGTLATIVSQDPMYVLFPVSAQVVLDYKQRMAGNKGPSGGVVVHIRLPNGRDYPHAGSVNFLDIQVNQGTDTVAVRAEFPNPEGWLIAGQIVDVTVEAGEPKQALVIPQAALQLDQSGPYVLVVGSDNKVEQQRVKLGAVEGSDTVVEQGLKQGERVIVQGIQKVRPGMVVAPAQEVPAAEATTTPQGTTAAPAAGTTP